MLKALFHRVQYKMKKKRAVKVRSSKKTYKGRGPSGKPKHSKVAKMIKLAKARSRKSGKKGKSKRRR